MSSDRASAGREDAGIDPGPEQGEGNREKGPPPEPEPAPEREDEDGKSGVAQDHTPRVGMSQPSFVVQEEVSVVPAGSPGLPPLRPCEGINGSRPITSDQGRIVP